MIPIDKINNKTIIIMKNKRVIGIVLAVALLLLGGNVCISDGCNVDRTGASVVGLSEAILVGLSVRAVVCGIVGVPVGVNVAATIGLIVGVAVVAIIGLDDG